MKGRMFYRCPERGVVKGLASQEFDPAGGNIGTCPHCMKTHPFFVVLDAPKKERKKEAAG